MKIKKAENTNRLFYRIPCDPSVNDIHNAFNLLLKIINNANFEYDRIVFHDFLYRSEEGNRTKCFLKEEIKSISKGVLQEYCYDSITFSCRFENVNFVLGFDLHTNEIYITLQKQFSCKTQIILRKVDLCIAINSLIQKLEEEKIGVAIYKPKLKALLCGSFVLLKDKRKYIILENMERRGAVVLSESTNKEKACKSFYEILKTRQKELGVYNG